MNRLFSSRETSFRHGEPPERKNSDDFRASIHSLQNVMPRKILLLEEDPYYVDVVKEAISEGTITIAPTWQNALKQLSHELYDLVIIAVARESDLDTMDLIRYQRKTEDGVNHFTPIVALIREGAESRSSEALESGCISAVQKPFTASMMRGVLVDQFNNTPSIFDGRNS
jgi:CheY-like chemotaxis protein